MRSSFNQLLITLSVLDIMFVTSSIWEYAMVKVWGIHLTIYIYIFPYLWYPMKNITMSWITFLVSAIATERYLAVCR